MDINIIQKANVSARQIQDVNALFSLCNHVDNTKYVFDNDSDFKEENDINTFLLYAGEDLVSVINIFAPTKKEAEIIALSKPEKRKNGYFNILRGAAEKELFRRGIPSILFVCDVNSADGNAVVRHLGSEYEYSEYLMSYKQRETKKPDINAKIRLHRARYGDVDTLVKINSSAFNGSITESRELIIDFFNSDKRRLYSISYENIIIGMIGIYKETSRHYIHGFCIDPEYQGRGIGRYSLAKTVDICLEEDKDARIELEVQTNNVHALNLYKNAGFGVETEFRYYRSGIAVPEKQI